MKFPYRKLFDRDPATGQLNFVQRPEITMTIIGPERRLNCSALVDTGADMTVLPTLVARTLRIPLVSTTHDETAFGGSRYPLLRGRVGFLVETDDGSVGWNADIFFTEFQFTRQETLILGQSNFLEYFRAMFDWEKGMLTLDPNGRVPMND